MNTATKTKMPAIIKIGTLHRVDFRGVIGLELSGTHRGELRGSIFDTCEYGRSTENTGDDGASGVEGLGKIQASVRTGCGSENRRIRIRGDFQEALSAGHDK